MTRDADQRRVPPTVLVIDDEPSILRLIKLQLSDLDVRIEVAGSGAAGLEAFDKLSPALVLVDLLMPGVSGVDVVREIRTRAATPIIVMTAGSSEETRLQALELGASDFVAKPFRTGRLQSAIESLLDIGVK